MDTKSAEPFVLETAWPSHTCATIAEYLQRAYEKLEQAGDPHAFRGVNRQFCNLRPSIDRVKITGAKAVEIETGLLEEFLLRAWGDLTPQERRRFLRSKARWTENRNTAAMVVARHRLVPTRCVDWTDCPWRALFFACDGGAESKGEVWWFNRKQFEWAVEVQWLPLYNKPGHVEAEIERDFRDRREGQWLTSLRYELMEDDRLDRQRGWITVAGRLGTCHAEEIHRLGVRKKGRLVIPPELKGAAIHLLTKLDITRESLGLSRGDPADEIARQIREEFERTYAPKKRAAPRKEDP